MREIGNEEASSREEKERETGREERTGETTWQEVSSDVDLGWDAGTLGSSEDERWWKALCNHS